MAPPRALVSIFAVLGGFMIRFNLALLIVVKEFSTLIVVNEFSTFNS